jgi:hypothetical protein
MHFSNLQRPEPLSAHRPAHHAPYQIRESTLTAGRQMDAIDRSIWRGENRGKKTPRNQLNLISPSHVVLGDSVRIIKRKQWQLKHHQLPIRTPQQARKPIQIGGKRFRFGSADDIVPADFYQHNPPRWRL